MDKTESGSILLFHNDLANTTEALPQVLTALKDKGFEFVTVSDLIYHDNYTIDAAGEQQPVIQSVLPLSDEEIEQALAQYSDELAAAGITDKQLAEVIGAVKNGDYSALPEQAQEVIAQVRAGLGDGTTVEEITEDVSDIETEQVEILPDTDKPAGK